MSLFSVTCPGCGVEKEHMTPTASQIGVHCGCGVTFLIDIEEQAVTDWHERNS